MRRFLPVLAVLALLASCGGDATDGPGPAPDSGIRGVVTTGPQCPVVQVGSPCPDAPWEGKINVTSDGFVTTTPTSADGRFSIALEPGTYTVLPFVSGPTSAEPVTVVVEAHRYAEVTLTVDTGIR